MEDKMVYVTGKIDEKTKTIAVTSFKEMVMPTKEETKPSDTP